MQQSLDYVLMLVLALFIAQPQFRMMDVPEGTGSAGVGRA